jgi:hypothetical protein
MHVVGWPLPASLVDRIESMRSRVAMFFSAGINVFVRRDTVTSDVDKPDVKPDARVYHAGFDIMMRMRVLRYAALVALVVWIGGLVTLGALVAPTAFAVVDARHVESGRMLVGFLFGAVFERFHLVAYAAGAVLLVSLIARRLLGPKPVHFGVRLGILCAMLAVTLYSGLILTGQVERTQVELGVPSSTLPAGDPGRLRFERRHHLSVAIAVITIVAGLVLVAYESAES